MSTYLPEMRLWWINIFGFKIIMRSWTNNNDKNNYKDWNSYRLSIAFLINKNDYLFWDSAMEIS